VNDNRAQQGQRWLELFPNPGPKNFAGGVFQAVDFVQIEMIQPLQDRLGGGFDVAVIDQVSPGGIDLAFHDHIEPKGMAMQSTAFVTVGESGQIMGGFKVKSFAEADEHWGNFKEMVAIVERWESAPLREYPARRG
jgi:hypothetical protein